MSLNPTQPRVLLHVEGGVVLALSLLLYWYIGANWILFLVLILAPDLAILSYLGGNKIGATIYNTVHTYLLPALLASFGLLTANQLALALALIWSAHIGGDRLLGFGLKYSTGFKDTHLKRV